VPAAAGIEAHPCQDLRICRVRVERLGKVTEVADGLEAARVRLEVAVDQARVLAGLRELTEAAPDRGEEPEDHQPRALD